MAGVEAANGVERVERSSAHLWAPVAWSVLTWGVAVLSTPRLILRFFGCCPPKGFRLATSVLYVLALLFVRVLPYLLIAFALCFYSLADAAYDRLTGRLRRMVRRRQKGTASLLARQAVR